MSRGHCRQRLEMRSAGYSTLGTREDMPPSLQGLHTVPRQGGPSARRETAPLGCTGALGSREARVRSENAGVERGSPEALRSANCVGDGSTSAAPPESTAPPSCDRSQIFHVLQIAPDAARRRCPRTIWAPTFAGISAGPANGHSARGDRHPQPTMALPQRANQVVSEAPAATSPTAATRSVRRP